MKKPTQTGPLNNPDTTTVPKSMNVQKQSVVVRGRVDGMPTNMLVDTRSMEHWLRNSQLWCVVGWMGWPLIC